MTQQVQYAEFSYRALFLQYTIKKYGVFCEANIFRFAKIPTAELKKNRLCDINEWNERRIIKIIELIE